MKQMQFSKGQKALIAGGIAATATLVGSLAWAADIASAKREVPTFSAVSLNGSMDVDVTVGGKQSVEIFGDARDLDHIETEVRGDTLRVKVERHYRLKDHIRVVVSMADLHGLAINGSGDANARNIDAKAFAMDINGSGDAHLSGKCESVTYEINGSGDIDADAFKCVDASVEINGSGDIGLTATGELALEVNGSGDITVYGKPRLRKFSSHGSGDLTIK